MPSSSPTPAQRAPARSSLHTFLEPLVSSLWVLFLVWSLLVAIVWILRLGEVEVERAMPGVELQRALGFLLRLLDPFWIVLAAANIYLALVAEEGLRVARRWALAVFAVALVVSLASRGMGWILGPIVFTERLGWSLFGVPIAFPLLWIVQIFGTRSLASQLLPRASHAQVAAAAGGLAAGAAFLLDPIALERAWWLWRIGNVPTGAFWGNFLTWGLVTAVLAFGLRGRMAPGVAKTTTFRPALVWIVVFGIVALTRVIRLLQA